MIDLNKRKWYAVYTRFKSEKIAHHYFQHTGIESYVPTTRTTKRYVRKIKHHDIPLISCYVFVKIEPKEHIQVLKNPYVIHFLKIGDEIDAIPEKEIQLLKKITGELNDVEVITVDQYAIGDYVEVILGNLTGLKGHIVETRGKQDFVVELVHIGIQLRIQIDPSHLNRIKKAAINRKALEEKTTFSFW